MSEKIAAAILMGGTGQRFGAPIPKQFVHLSGKSIYLYTFETFFKSGLFSEIIIVCPKEYVSRVEEETKGKAKVICGGKTRQESSFFACNACHEETAFIAIHDAVRPFVTEEILKRNLSLVKKFHAVDTCIRATDTMIRTTDHKFIHEIPKREYYYRGQTPQTFSLELIKNAHLRAIQDGFLGTDDCSLVHRLAHPVHITEGSDENIKITSDIDLTIAEHLLRKKNQTILFSENNLQGKTFIITGGKGSIGGEISQYLEKKGAKTIPISKTSAPYSADLSDADQAKEIFSRIEKEVGEVDGIINSIGHLLVKPLEELSPAEINQTIQSNLMGLIYSCKYAKIKKQGHIINIASSSYSRGRKDYVIYSSAKAAVVNFTQGLSEEMPQYFINALAPKRTLSEMRKKNFPEEKTDQLILPREIAEEVFKILNSKETGLIVPIAKKAPSN